MLFQEWIAAPKKAVMVLCMVCSVAFPEIFEHEHEIGGGMSIAYSGGEGTHGNTSIILSPFYNYYFSEKFSIGPIFSIVGPDDTFLELGLRIAVGEHLNRSYLYFSPGVEWATMDDYHVIGIPISAGMKVLLTDNFGIDPSIYFVPLLEEGVVERFNAGIMVSVFGLL